jgi:hypothetical protein
LPEFETFVGLGGVWVVVVLVEEEVACVTLSLAGAVVDFGVSVAGGV